MLYWYQLIDAVYFMLRKRRKDMSITMTKQEQMMKLFETMDEIRPKGKGGGHHHKGGCHEGSHHEGPHHGGPHHGGPHCGCGHGQEEGKEECGHRPPRGGKMHQSGGKLLHILLREGKLNQRSIASMMNVSAQAVSDLVKKMEHRELICKESGEINNENMISLTEKGREIAQEVESEMKEYAEKLFADFSEEELATLQNIMEKLEKNVK